MNAVRTHGGPGSAKVAIITGASQGIGAGLVDAFRAAGYAVVATSRRIDPVDDPQLATASSITLTAHDRRRSPPSPRAGWSIAELIEAAVRAGSPDRAVPALCRLSERAHVSGSDWALGIEARSRALLSDGDAADDLYREAIERLARTHIRAELARAHLLYGEWLRRERRRVDAREHLRIAHETLAAMGIDAFAERARRELLATGETVRKRTVETRDELTAQEGQIASLAAGGRTNPEIGAQLFLSPRTVEWHLRKVFTKLGISSRKELVGALPSAARVPLVA